MELALNTLLFLGLVCTSWAALGPVVMTNSGPVEGYTDHLTEPLYIGVYSDFDVFLGVPYAKPPVGDLRFANPVSPDPWMVNHLAIFLPPQCPQATGGGPDGVTDEDCLYLNVYAPSPKPQGASVMVFFHGGAYNVGSSSRQAYSGIPLAGVGGVIVVTINYRLGPLGFLSTADNAAKGSFGSLDQVFALQWVQDNIANFGGDPASVTIFGESAGATSVGLHLVSQASHHLFARAIMESGSVYTDFAYNPDIDAARSEAFMLGDNAGCSTTDSALLIDCLRTKTWQEVLVAGLQFKFLSAPVVDGTFLTADPILLQSSGLFKHCNVLIGSNHDEGTTWAVTIYPSYALSATAPLMTKDDYYAHRADFITGYLNDIILDAMDQQYVDWGMVDYPSADYLDAYVREITDQTFVAPADLVARDFYEHGAGNAYVYQMTHVPTVPAYSIGPIGPGWLGVTHGEEIPFVFGWTFIPEMAAIRMPLLPTENHFMAKMMTYWTNFAKTGNPNGVGLPTWPAYTVPDQEYMILELEPNLVAGRALRANDVAFWNKFVPELIAFSKNSSST